MGAMRRALIVLGLFVAMLPAPAWPCLLVTAEGPLAQTGFRALLMPTPDGRDTEMVFQVAFTGEAPDGRIGVAIPFSVAPDPVGVGVIEIDPLPQATRPTVVRPAPTGCGAASCNGAMIERPIGVNGGISRFHVTMEPTGTFDLAPPGAEGHGVLEDWLEANDFVLGGRSGQRVALEAILDGGGHLLLFTGTSREPNGATRSVSVRLPGAHLEVPLAAAAGCATSPFELELYAVADGRVVPSGDEAHAGLQDLDRDLVRGSEDLDGVIRTMARTLDRRFFLTEYALPVERLRDHGLFGVGTDLGARGSHVTRIRSVLVPGELTTDLGLVTDRDAPPVEPLLDVSFDPRAHGAAIPPGGWLAAGLLALVLATLRRRSGGAPASR
jgi:hypothetical protein